MPEQKMKSVSGTPKHTRTTHDFNIILNLLFNLLFEEKHFLKHVVNTYIIIELQLNYLTNNKILN